jgi:hypothetical protein
MFNVQLEPTITKRLTGRSRAELTNVGLSGDVANLIITKNAEITQIQINHLVGSGSFTIEIYSDVSLSDKVFSAISDDTGEILMFNKIGLEFENTDTPTANNLCYMKVIPSSGVGHTFKCAIFYNKL